ncbi:MAG TPA: ABC transporter ATP-binding protein [Caulobacteraceae bacterium]|nr:ABC transporter ATP-binding protein [Caulobacteraceae bacterium]
MSVLTAEGLSLNLGGARILDGVDLVLRPGEVTAVVGPNGAGKSTLLACLAGLLRPDSGQARLGSEAVLAMPARRRAQQIGFLPQAPEIAWAVDVETLVGLGRTPFTGFGGASDVDKAAVARAMAAAELEPLAGRIVTTLSGGERGRVLLARALAGEPAWLLADEPMAGLDPAHLIDAAELFRALAHEQGKGVVLTLHDLTLAMRVAERVVVLSKGAVVADGPPLEAVTPDILARVYGVDARLSQGEGGTMVELVGRRPKG